MTPSGSCVIRSSSFCAASTNTFCSRSARADSARKKSRRPSRPFSSLRDWRIGLPTSCVSVLRERLRSARRSARETSRSLRGACASASPPSAAARRAPLRSLRARLRADRRRRRRSDGAPVAGLVIDSVVVGIAIALRLPRAHGVEEFVEDRRAVEVLVADARTEHELRDAIARRTRSSDRASGSPRRCRPARPSPRRSVPRPSLFTAW